MKNIFSVLLLLSTSIAYACYCIDPNSIAEEFSYSEVVVFGTVTSIRYCSPGETINPKKLLDLEQKLDEQTCDLLFGEMVQQVVVKIETNFKSPRPIDTLIINTPKRGASCGFISKKEKTTLFIPTTKVML